jgi:hypothetical protein
MGIRLISHIASPTLLLRLARIPTTKPTKALARLPIPIAISTREPTNRLIRAPNKLLILHIDAPLAAPA